MVGLVDECEFGNAIEALPMLTERECEEVRSKLHELRHHWLQRRPDLPMYSLGAAGYLDAKERESPYTEAASLYNPILRGHFGWLYTRLEEVLSTRLGGPGAYPPEKALPGFHLFLADPRFTRKSAHVHADMQYQYLDWSWARTVSGPMSFTLAISLPREGGGINLWDISARQLVGLPDAEANRVLGEATTRFVAHRTGHLTLQFGHLIHQIATPTRMVEGDERFTLQGHGLLCDGVWQFYW